MMDSELLQSSWPPLYNTTFSLDHAGFYSYPMDVCTDDQAHHDFSSSFASTREESSGISFDSYFAAAAAMTSASPADSLQHVEFPTLDHDEMQVVDSLAHYTIMEGLERFSSSSRVEIDQEDCRWLEPESDDFGSGEDYINNSSLSHDKLTPESNASTTSIILSEEMDLTNFPTDNQLCLHHLLTAFGEAAENDHQELAEVIVKRINERIHPLGEPLERVAFNLFQSAENHGNYLRQQSILNFDAAFKAFYQWFPYGRFAHLTANSAILEAMPCDAADSLHVVDFDMGEGIQWPPLMDAIIRRKGKSLRLTSIRSREDHDSSPWIFEETRQRLYDHARSLGLSLSVEEMSLEHLASEMKRRMNKSDGATEWLAFNLMVALPHMGRRPDRSSVLQFLTLAKDLLAYSAGKGIITIGDGEAGGYLQNCPEYTSYFSSHLTHYQALFESMQSNFPDYLAEARIAMENLFLAPYVSSHSWFQQSKDTRGGEALYGLDSRRMSRESLIEAKEIVNEHQTSYRVNFRKDKENEMDLEWRGIPLVRVSSWV